jgi:hypothetical protein
MFGYSMIVAQLVDGCRDPKGKGIYTIDNNNNVSFQTSKPLIAKVINIPMC